MPHPIESLARPPRAVPFGLRLALRFGGVGGVIGWIFVAFSMIFVVVFAAIGDFGTALKLRTAELGRVEGTTLGWEHTNAQVNDRPVIANGAVFHVNGRRFECRSYAVAHGMPEGQRVTIEYARSDPSVCRIEGFDVSLLPWWVMLIIAPFVLIGLLFALSSWVRGGRAIGLLARGEVAWGTLAGRRATNVRINDRTQFRCVFRFEDARGRAHEVVARTTDTATLEDDPREPVLYDPHRPSRALLVDVEGRLLRPDGHGGWRSPGVGVLVRLIAPIISVGLMVLTWLVI